MYIKHPYSDYTSSMCLSQLQPMWKYFELETIRMYSFDFILAWSGIKMYYNKFVSNILKKWWFLFHLKILSGSLIQNYISGIQ